LEFAIKTSVISAAAGQTYEFSLQVRGCASKLYWLLQGSTSLAGDNLYSSLQVTNFQINDSAGNSLFGDPNGINEQLVKILTPAVSIAPSAVNFYETPHAEHAVLGSQTQSASGYYRFRQGEIVKFTSGVTNANAQLTLISAFYYVVLCNLGNGAEFRIIRSS